jgi:hypothetical protein
VSAARALACLATLLVGCIPEPLAGPADGAVTASDTGPAVDGSGGGPDGAADAGASDSHATTDSGGGLDGIAPSDASDASDVVIVPDGSIRCGPTSTTCDYATSECCDEVLGQLTGTGPVYATTQAHCEAIGGPNCGFYGSTGSSYQFLFAQTCVAGTGCAAGSVCCAEVADAGAFNVITQIGCQSAAGCGSTGHTLCQGNGDCLPPQTCKPESDPVLSNVYARYCQ